MNAARWLPRMRVSARPVARLDSRTRVGAVDKRRSVRPRRRLVMLPFWRRRKPQPGVPWSRRVPRLGAPWSRQCRSRTDAAAVVLPLSAERRPVPQRPAPRGLLQGARRRPVPRGPRPQSPCLPRPSREALLELNRPGARSAATALLVIVVVLQKPNAFIISRKFMRWMALAAVPKSSMMVVKKLRIGAMAVLLKPKMARLISLIHVKKFQS